MDRHPRLGRVTSDQHPPVPSTPSATLRRPSGRPRPAAGDVRRRGGSRPRAARPLPRRLRRPRGADRATLAAVRAETPVDERETVARDAFVERLAVATRWSPAVPAGRCLSSAAAPRAPRGVRPDADRRRGGAGATSTPASRASPRRSTATGRRSRTRPAQGRVSAARQYAEVAEQVAQVDRPGGRGRRLLRRPGGRLAPTARCATTWTPHAAAAARRRSRTSAGSSATSSPRAAASRRPSAASDYALAARYFLGADDRPRGDLRLGLGGAQADRATRWPRPPTGSSRAATRRRGRRRPRRRPGRRIHGKREVPRLDAGPRRPHRRRAGRRALRHPRPDHAASSADSPRPTTAASTTPGRVEDFTPARPDVVVGARRRRRLRHLARGHHRLPRGRARASPPGRARRAYRTELLNRWQRLMCWVSGHGEGWALYAERLMDDLGYLERPRRPARHARRPGLPGGPGDHRHRHAPGAGDPGGQPVRLPPRRDLDARPRAGVHARSTAGWRTSSSGSSCNRYLGWPGQAPSYKVGERIWLEARDEAKARAGRRVRPQGVPPRRRSTSGSLGLDPLRRALARAVTPLVLASASPARLATLRAAGVEPG